MNWGNPRAETLGGVLGESFASFDAGNLGETGGIDECEVRLPKGSIGITFEGFPATVREIDSSSPFKLHGVYPGMMVDTVTVFDVHNAKKVYYELDTDRLVDLLQKQQISRDKCMVRFVAPHYIVTPPPIPTALDFEFLTTEYDNVSLLNMKDGDEGTIDGDSDSDGEIRQATANIVLKNKNHILRDAPTEETTDDEEFDGDAGVWTDMVYGLPHSKNNFDGSEYNADVIYHDSDDVYEAPPSSKKNKSKSSTVKPKSKSAVTPVVTKKKTVNSSSLKKLTTSSSGTKKPTTDKTKSRSRSSSKDGGVVKPVNKNKKTFRTLKAANIVKTTAEVKKSASKAKLPSRERIASPVPIKETREGLWA
mmetsp:Transcript_26691/g.39470  ORF Transcript_26691/g.39470 Transcript_26691/m.39470 type:complete len:364 (+) Transcript_26691:159-1250(+)|eukprot:CAMPEP_0194220152 /NCGR_PEP_ID=MMETSP0156-20130528/27600_1 /TAXON_ID=33649 /ORGANISM="Thalassionema nitzschioides, Strain L26-B" /LENGTH=363 /DNA_ID=CAMNT_0038950061 /DNA_START=84 /DNA_END=1175 /DNA_ORIENTATION=+